MRVVPIVVQSVPRWTLITGWGGLLLVALSGGLATGLSGVLIFASLYAAVVAIVGLVRARVGWAFLRRRLHAGVALGIAIVGLGLGGAIAPAAPKPALFNPPAVVTSSSSTTAPTPTTTTTSGAATTAPTSASTTSVGSVTSQVTTPVPAPSVKPSVVPEAPAPPSPPPPVPPAPSSATVLQGVHPGAYCSPQGGLGVTSSGTAMVCRPSATDSRSRWRSP